MSAETSWSRIIQEIGKNQKIPIPGPVGSLQMMLVKFNWTTNSAYWQQMHWKLVSKTPVLLKHKGRELKSFTVKTEK
jgi:hypothetical protein